jgi:hypothetical protein
MFRKQFIHNLALISFFLVGSILLALTIIPAEAAAEPRLSHKACTTHCVFDQTILRSSMGDTQAENAYLGWYDTYYELTGCSDSAMRNVFELALDIVGDVIGAGGGTTMQCWQGLLAQASSCSDACSDYFVTDGKYGPNVRVALNDGVPGSLGVTLSNNDYGYLPEETPNAYSLKFYLNTTLQYEDRPALLVDHMFMNSMSYSNWITRGGMDNCISSYGMDDERCMILSSFNTPNIIPTEVNFMDGVLYDISSHARSSGARYSFEGDGFILLESDGENVTIDQGPYSGYAWVKVHNQDAGTHTSQLTYWDATYGSVTIENHECNSWWCSLTGDRVDADTYVFALQGPEELRLEGTYTVDVTADIVHDKDFSNNSVSYSYTDLDVGSTSDAGGEDEEEPMEVTLDQITVVDLPGPGEYFNNLSSSMPGVMYRLNVPEGINFLYLRVFSQDGGNFPFYVKRGSIPDPSTPMWQGGYDCIGEGTSAHTYGCPFTSAPSGSYYIFLPSGTTGTAFKLEVMWITDSEIATENASYEATLQVTPEIDATGEIEATEDVQGTEEEDQEEGQTSLIYTEVEPNNSRATANLWDMTNAFTGQLPQWGDGDYISVSFDFSGIYTFTLSGYSSNNHGVLMLLRGPSGGFLNSINEPDAPASLTFDASAGEQYFFFVDAYSIDEVGSDYALEMTGFIADPDEPNDDADHATFWDLTVGDQQGYFFDKTTGRYDYYKFVAPETQENSPTTITISNPGDDIRICMTLLNYRRYHLESVPCSPAGEPSIYSFDLEAGQEYYLKINTLDWDVSTFPYTISADYQPAVLEDVADVEEFIIKGNVHDPWGLIKLPVTNAEIYIQINGQPAVLLDTTNLIGKYKGTITLNHGDEVRVWAVKDGLTFMPEEDVFYANMEEGSHRSVFMVIGELAQETPTPGPDQTGTEPPPLIRTGLAMTITPGLERNTLTPTLTPSPQSTRTPTPTPTIDYANATIFTGTIWRLFADSGPAGVAAVEVILSVNGVDQATTSSRIDGTYLITLNGIQPGDILRIRAQGTEDLFEPAYYEWQAEAGVDKWDYEFYSYWDEITPPVVDDQNRLYGWVLNGMGQGIPGVYLNVMMGNSDALQRVGPTDANGFYDGTVYLPSRIMVTIWVDGEGFLPSRLQFFHAYDLENREINFRQESVGMQ